MPECHKCPKNGCGSKDCLKCRGPAETNHHGKIFVSFNSEVGSDPQTGAQVEAALQRFEEAKSDPPAEAVLLPDCCADTARRLLGVVMSLKPNEFSILAWRMNGGDLAKFAKSEGLTRQGVHIKWKRIVGRHPELAALFR